MKFLFRLMVKLFIIAAVVIMIRRLMAKNAPSDGEAPARKFSILKVMQNIFEKVNQKVQWYELPAPLQVLNLIALRDLLRERNLHDTETLTPASGSPTDSRLYTSRTPDGSYNDLKYPDMGKAGMRFARNFPLQHGYPDEANMFNPSPRTISRELMTRHSFQAVPSLNVLAAAWLQFNVHDWFAHGPNEVENPIEVPLDPDDPWHEHPMRIQRTKPDPTWSPDEGIPPTFRNTESHWWGMSQIYGSTQEIMDSLRTREGGKLKVADDGLLPIDPETGLDITGFNDNWWVGLSLLHNLFTMEHNAICERLKPEYPNWTDDQFYDHARLINSALMAKFHTVEWTPGILATPVLNFSMRGNWWGALGEQFSRLYGRVGSSDILSGIMGSDTEHHTGIYAMTEEFTAVYRMHALMPDEFAFRAYNDDSLIQQHDFPDVAFENARKRIGEVSMENAFYSLGTSHPGAITLHNFPRFLQELTDPSGQLIDLASVDIMRDRERGIPRYNQFRRLLHMPPVQRFEDLTSNQAWAEEIRRVYNNDIEMVDPMVGLYAETPPPGFGFSDTAFRIFILMASRRLKSDRFFTNDFRPEIYTKTGLDWIADNNMASVILRHFPALRNVLSPASNAFAPWKKAG